MDNQSSTTGIEGVMYVANPDSPTDNFDGVVARSLRIVHKDGPVAITLEQFGVSKPLRLQIPPEDSCRIRQNEKRIKAFLKKAGRVCVKRG